VWASFRSFCAGLFKHLRPSPQLPFDIRLSFGIILGAAAYLAFAGGRPWQNVIAIYGILSGIWGAWLLYKDSIETDKYFSSVAEAMIALVPRPPLTTFNRAIKWILVLLVAVAYLRFLLLVWSDFAVDEDYSKLLTNAFLVLIVATFAALPIYGYFWAVERAFETVKQTATLSAQDRIVAVKNGFRTIGFYGLFFAGLFQLPILLWPPK
jgi:hypothetical protein